ncbi:50S ribosomal protein L24 [Candidatus Saccharibacteria bacterium]|nr:50S ribosomal protein L24 [Candidatus Saccharibacteria bacterium]
MRLKKGDAVVVISGKYKGVTGKVLKLHPTLNKVTIEGVNVVKKHQKPNKEYPQGGIIELTQPIWVSKVALVEQQSKKASKIGYIFDKDGSKKRVYKKTGKEIK